MSARHCWRTIYSRFRAPPGVTCSVNISSVTECQASRNCRCRRFIATGRIFLGETVKCKITAVFRDPFLRSFRYNANDAFCSLHADTSSPIRATAPRDIWCAPISRNNSRNLCLIQIVLAICIHISSYVT